jgi:hypothetical protein
LERYDARDGALGSRWKPGPRLCGAALLLLLTGLAAPPARADDRVPTSDRPDDVFTSPREPRERAPSKPSPGWTVGRTSDVFESEGLATRVGGWLDASYQDNDLESESINVNHFNLYFDTRLGRSWQAFLEVEFENEPGVRGFEEEREYEVEQAYGRWIASDTFDIRVGQFNTPFGIWTPLHWSILMDTITEPIHEGTRVTPEQEVGVELAGRLFLRDWFQNEQEMELSYSLYTGYGDHTEVFEEQGSDGPSVGSDLRLRFHENSLIGLSLYQQRREQEDARDRTERSFMLYGECRPLERLTLRTEIFRQFRDRHVGPQLSRRINIGYVSGRWELTPRSYLAYRYNYGDDEGEGASDERHTHTVTLGFRPTSSLRLKLEYARNDFVDTDRRDFNYWGVSVGILF